MRRAGDEHGGQGQFPDVLFNHTYLPTGFFIRTVNFEVAVDGL